MMCNTVLNEEPQKNNENSKQDEWTPYTACQNLSLGCGNKDILRNCFDSCVIFKETLNKDKENLSTLLSKQTPTDKSCPCIAPAIASHNKYDNDIGKTKCPLNMVQTAMLWKSIVNNCDVEKRIHWQDSLENKNFLNSLSISYKSKFGSKEKFSWNFKCYGCLIGKQLQKMKLRNHEEQLNKLDDSEDGCNSDCCSQRFYISQYGVVFSSLEEKQIFDEKMAKMDNLLKSELNTIREQHDRLQKFILKEESKETIGGWSEECFEGEKSTKGDDENDATQYDLNLIEDQERAKSSIFDNFKGLLNINKPWEISDRVPGRNL